jgi:ketosteroid isomerase-like protein
MIGAELEDETMDTKAIGERLVALCREGKNMEAVNSLYADDVVSVEPHGTPEMQQTQKGIDAIRGKNEWFFGNHEIHSASAEGPMVNGDKFTVVYEFDATAGPYAGQRNKMKEVGLYTVGDDGKIVHEQFFY